MTESEIRAAVNKWSAESISRQKHLGDRMTILQTTAVSSYVVRFTALREQRTVTPAADHEDTPIDTREARVDPQSIHVQPPTGFEDAAMKLRIPGTRQIATCTRCKGTGNVVCGKCEGKGKTKCIFCHGFGSVRQMRNQPVFHNGRTTFQMQMVTVPCTCQRGWVKCKDCKTRGTITCAGCSGKGQVRTVDMLHVQFRSAASKRIVNATGVPDDLLIAAHGTTIVDTDPDSGTTPPDLAPEVDAAIAALRQEFNGGDGRVLRRRLQVDRVPVCCVQFTADKGASGKLWVYGIASRVHAPDVGSRWFNWLRR